ncbi:hypothetical protein EKO27_g3471 [Xylaria grammica]|uniref:ribose-phosphate diphosphokinase n=1 Tax=Xylaria grammica TaxID=363999 RepID=A0A439DB36_9PEZI|nr:hypothetical protein EKO27_g3471 [Xylaria grammica]
METSLLIHAAQRHRSHDNEPHPPTGFESTVWWSSVQPFAATAPSVLRWIRENRGTEDVVIVSPGAGGAKRTTAIADRLDRGFALIRKQPPWPDVVGRMVLVGDVVDKVAILVNDMAETSETLTKAAQTVTDHGAREATAIVTHGILSVSCSTVLSRLMERGGVGNLLGEEGSAKNGVDEGRFAVEIASAGFHRVSDRRSGYRDHLHKVNTASLHINYLKHLGFEDVTTCLTWKRMY